MQTVPIFEKWWQCAKKCAKMWENGLGITPSSWCIAKVKGSFHTFRLQNATSSDVFSLQTRKRNWHQCRQKGIWRGLYLFNWKLSNDAIVTEMEIIHFFGKKCGNILNKTNKKIEKCQHERNVEWTCIWIMSAVDLDIIFFGSEEAVKIRYTLRSCKPPK